jgi:hypothetical protein
MYKVINFPKIKDPRGNLTFLQFPNQIPFIIERVFWTYDVSSGEKRGGHAYKTQQEVIIALSGSFDIFITEKNGFVKKINLNNPYTGLFLPSNTWRHIENYSTNALSLHLSSMKYDELDYIRNFNFL